MVFIFPKLLAAIVTPLSEARVLNPVMANSLAKTTIMIHAAIAPLYTNITKADIVNILSASGYINFPKFVTKLCFLAIYPSKASLNAAI